MVIVSEFNEAEVQIRIVEYNCFYLLYILENCFNLLLRKQNLLYSTCPLQANGVLWLNKFKLLHSHRISDGFEYSKYSNIYLYAVLVSPSVENPFNSHPPHQQKNRGKSKWNEKDVWDYIAGTENRLFSVIVENGGNIRYLTVSLDFGNTRIIVSTHIFTRSTFYALAKTT